MKKIITILISIVLLSSCATNRSHSQVKKGKYTIENKKPDCINAW